MTVEHYRRWLTSQKLPEKEIEEACAIYRLCQIEHSTPRTVSLTVTERELQLIVWALSAYHGNPVEVDRLWRILKDLLEREST